MTAIPAELDVSTKVKNPESSHNSTSAPDSNLTPDGGARGWLAAGGGSAIFFCTLGFANSFGTFEEYYLTHQLLGESPSKISWIGSLNMFLQFFVGMIAGPLFDRYGAKVGASPSTAYPLSCDLTELSHYRLSAPQPSFTSSP